MTAQHTYTFQSERVAGIEKGIGQESWVNFYFLQILDFMVNLCVLVGVLRNLTLIPILQNQNQMPKEKKLPITQEEK